MAATASTQSTHQMMVSDPLRLASTSSYNSQASSITPPTSENSSPSPRSPLSHIPPQAKQIRTLRSPMYVPAVLRPTEKPPRASPPSGISSAIKSPLDGSVESIGSLEEGQVIPVRRVESEEINESRMGTVTGPPSRNHWKPDRSTEQCDSRSCTRPFTFFQRRHHCRRCGAIFCGPHSDHFVPLDQHARFHPRACAYRACDDCWHDYREWDQRRISWREELLAKKAAANGKPDLDREQTDQLPQDGSATSAPTTSTPVESGRERRSFMDSIAQSVPKDWNWSTF